MHPHPPPAQISPKHTILLSLPRTASHLLIRLLNLPSQPAILHHAGEGYFYMPALRYRREHSTLDWADGEWSDEVRGGMEGASSSGLDAWNGHMNQADSEGKGTFIKEHLNWTTTPIAETRYLHLHESKSMEVYNPTNIPSSLLSTTQPTFLIRHPALTFPSLFRTARENEGIDTLRAMAGGKMMVWECTFHWHVTLYKYLLYLPSYPRPSNEEGVQFPIILDAADLKDEALVKKYARAVGLCESVVRYEWKAATREECEGLGGMERRMKATLLRSEGVNLGRLRANEDVDVAREREAWKEEFGEEVGERLGEMVQKAMEDYVWLRERRLRL